MDGTVQGKAASDLELRVARALSQLKIEFIFQYPIKRGRDRIGGFVVDFIAQTPPKDTPILVHGEYWHRPSNKSDPVELAILRSMRQFAEPLILWGADLQSEAEALDAVRQGLGL